MGDRANVVAICLLLVALLLWDFALTLRLNQHEHALSVTMEAATILLRQANSMWRVTEL